VHKSLEVKEYLVKAKSSKKRHRRRQHDKRAARWRESDRPAVESTEGISEIWVRETFPGCAGLEVSQIWGKGKFTNGKEFTRSYSETLLWSNSRFDSLGRV